jgi:hypothetical protein
MEYYLHSYSRPSVWSAQGEEFYLLQLLYSNCVLFHVVTVAWYVLRLWIEESASGYGG